MGVDPSELERAPKISDLLKMVAGGLGGVLNALRFSVDPDVQAWLEAYDSLSNYDRQYAPWEAICIKAGVDPRTLLGAAAMAVQTYSRDSVKLLAVSAHPDVVRKRIEFAKLATGVRDRDALDQAMGFLPTARGSTFIINPLHSAKALDDDGPDDELPGREVDIDKVFPDAERMQHRIVDLQTKLLGS
jgi:hypothetical protein